MTHYFKHQMRTKKFGSVAAWILLGITAVTAIALLLGYIIMLLWNWLMPEIFGLISINYWQAIGIIIFAKILFGGFGHHKSEKSKRKFHDHFNKQQHDIPKSDFAKWKFYDKFWQDEGEHAYNEYVERIQNQNLT